MNLTSSGEQPSRAVFGIGDSSSKPLCESWTSAAQYWGISAEGSNVRFRLLWGTRASRSLSGILSPLVAYLPGRVSLQVSLADVSRPGEAISTMTPSGPGDSSIRTVQLLTGPLPRTAAKATALAAATVTLEGVPVVLATGETLCVGGESDLTAGGPLLLSHQV